MSRNKESSSRSRSHGRQDVCAPSGKWRTFCAIEIPTDVAARVAEHIDNLREAFPEVRASWTRAGKLHLTLKFLGEISRSRVADLSRAAERATASLAPFKAVIEGAGAFPKSGPPKVLWLGISDINGELTELHKRLEDECAKEGFAKEERTFNPHLTLARLRTTHDARPLSSLHSAMEFAAKEISVNELLVIRSELSSEGSKYTVISRHPLTGKADI
jgi:2'-5' RNA ligase